MVDGRQVVCLGFGPSPAIRLWDINGDGSAFEHVYQAVEDEVSKIAISPIENSIAIMTTKGVIKLARRVRDITWTIEVVADEKRFNKRNLSFTASGQLLATVRVDVGVEIWDPIQGKCLVSERLSAVKNLRRCNFRLTGAFWQQPYWGII